MPRRSIKEEKTSKKVKLGVKIEKRSVRKKPFNADVKENTVEKTQDAILERKGNKHKEPDRNHEQEERKKEMIMWIGVSICMFLIVGIWLYNTKQVFEAAKAKNTSQSSAIDDLRKVSEEIGRQVEEARKQAEELVATSTEATSTNMPDELGVIAPNGVLPANEEVGANPTMTASSSRDATAASAER